MSAHRGKERKLQGPPLGAGECLPMEKDSPQRRERVEVSLPHVETARQDLTARRTTDRHPGEKGGKPEVEEEYETPSEEAMEE